MAYALFLYLPDDESEREEMFDDLYGYLEQIEYIQPYVDEEGETELYVWELDKSRLN